MKPTHAKPQSGRAIEPSLALYIVSKRGHPVGFGQTGLLFTNRQWVTENKTMSNDEGAYVMLPLTFPTKCVTALLSDTYGRLSNSSAMANQTEGAKVNAVTINSVQIISYWSGGLNTAVTVLAIGY